MSSIDNCFVCDIAAEVGRRGDVYQCLCKRCGPYEISGTAKAVLSGRLNSVQDIARFSFGIRSNTSESDWLYVDTANLDDISKTELPNLKKQMELTLQWLINHNNSDPLSSIDMIESVDQDIAGYIGLISVSGVDDLFDEMEKYDLVEIVSKTMSSREVKVTKTGHDFIDDYSLGFEEELKSIPKVTEGNVINALCANCGSNRNSNVLSHASKANSDEEVQFYFDYYVYECMGCGDVNVMKETACSEWAHVDHDPHGQPIWVNPTEKRYLNTITKYSPPDFISDITDETLTQVLSETYSAFNLGFLFLSSIGARVALERLMTMHVGDQRNFHRLRDEMLSQGYITQRDSEVLAALIDVGNASSHRGHAPSSATLKSIFKVAENLVHRLLISPAEVARIADETPSRS